MPAIRDGMSWRRFIALLRGLSFDSKFWNAIANKPKKMSTKEVIAALDAIP